MAVLRFLGLLAFAALAVACSGGAASDTIIPITGIAVRAESVTAGKGCGRGATQVFKYAVLVGELGPSTTPGGPRTFGKLITSNVFDCFTDGTFVELPADADGFGQYAVLVYAFNEAAYRAAGGDALVREAVRNPADVVKKTNPTWSTKCDAEQKLLVQSVVRCDPLNPSSAASSVALSLATFPSAGGALTCDKDYVTVIYRFSTNGGAPGASSETPCSRAGTPVEAVSIQISPAVAPATYKFEVAPIRADGSAIGQTTCTATTSPGLGSSAECAPVK